jgi:hypothetical protein
VFPVVGIATVAIDDKVTNYFDCVTNLSSNNGSGIRWTNQRGFNFDPIPGESPGKRLNLPGITTADLGVYTCWDNYSDDVAKINITDCEYYFHLIHVSIIRLSM